MSKRDIDLVSALSVVITGAQNHYEQVLKETKGEIHPLYREAIPVVQRHFEYLIEMREQRNREAEDAMLFMSENRDRPRRESS